MRHNEPQRESATMSTLNVTELKCNAQPYAWGKPGKTSAVARILSENGQSVDAEKPYAELWMGTHPSAPSVIASSNASLQSYVGQELPYLYKVLSVSTALSIQAHPDLSLAPRLHAENPKEYRDANHKPEMATALTTFEAMCGFRVVEEISKFLQSVPEFRVLVTDSVSQEFISSVASEQNNKEKIRSVLKKLFNALMTASSGAIHQHLDSLLARIDNEKLDGTPESVSDNGAININVFGLVKRLQHQYPYDVGVFCPFVLNCIRIEPGRTLFLGANEPHAYISGDIVECMACSDNVVRAGLTPKFRDVPNLVSMLTYASGPVHFLSERRLDEFTTQFLPPIPEFALQIKKIPGKKSSTFLSIPSHAIALVYQGNANVRQPSTNSSLSVKSGTIFLIPANSSVDIENSSAEHAVLYICSTNTEVASKL